MKRRTRPVRARATDPAAIGSSGRFPTSKVVAALALACVVLITLWLIPVPHAARTAAPAAQEVLPDGSVWRVGMPRPDGLRIVVAGRNDAGMVLDAQQFSRPEVRQGYWIATQIPAILNQLYCWCGCENRGIHRSNLQCFEDKMAEDCPVCLGTAEMAYDMAGNGIADAATIQAAVDVRWRPDR